MDAVITLGADYQTYNRNGQLVDLKTLKLGGDIENYAKNNPVILFQGEEYYLQKVIDKETGKEKSIYCQPEKDEEGNITDELKYHDISPNGDDLHWYSYDRLYFNNFFKALDNFCGTSPDAPCTDNDGDNGSIGFWAATKHFIKGAIVNPVKAMIQHPIVTAAVMVGIKVATVVASAVAGVSLAPWILGAALVMGTVVGTISLIKAFTSDTDAQAKAAWEGVGTAATTIFLAGKGLKGCHAAAGTTKAVATARADAIEEIDAVKSLVGQGYLSQEAAKAEIADILQVYHATDKGALVSTKAAEAIAKLAPQAPSVTITADVAAQTPINTGTPHEKLSPLEEARKAALQSLKDKVDTATKPVRSVVNGVKNLKTIPEDSKFMGTNDSLGQSLRTKIAQTHVFGDFKNAGIDDVKRLCEQAQTLVVQGKPIEAKEAMLVASKIIKAGQFDEAGKAAAEQLYNSATALVKLAQTPWSTYTIMPSFFGGNANNDMSEIEDLLKESPILVE